MLLCVSPTITWIDNSFNRSIKEKKENYCKFFFFNYQSISRNRHIRKPRRDIFPSLSLSFLLSFPFPLPSVKDNAYTPGKLGGGGGDFEQRG